MDDVRVDLDALAELLSFFAKTAYKAAEHKDNPKMKEAMDRTLALFAVDYNFSVMRNDKGELSSAYPSTLIVLESEKQASSSSSSSEDHLPPTLLIDESFMAVPAATQLPPEANKLKDLCSKARFARCRARFPLPVILYKDKYICRSATLSGGPEIYGRSSLEYFLSSPAAPAAETSADANVPDSPPSARDWQFIDRVRAQDIRLLRTFAVHTIVDLMVEKKKVKFGVNVTSSEKVDKENRYEEFRLLSLPYPGCEFFREFRDRGYCGDGLWFEWAQAYVDAPICVPPDTTSDSVGVDWSRYREWDLVTLTGRYVALLLAYVKEPGPAKGLLVHCISGWDRTPLFISLIRLSLWADGLVHRSLDPFQVLYLTLAYDWLLFGHNLPDRVQKGEEILFFCFYFLKHLLPQEYSLHYRPPGPPSSSTSSSSSPTGSNWSLDSTEQPPIRPSTSPVPVPISSAPRTRPDSTSSASNCGSWQMVSESLTERAHSAEETDEEDWVRVRAQRLSQVRSVFYSLYGTSVGFTRDSSQSGGGGGGGGGVSFGAFIGNFASKVGLNKTS